MTAPVVVAVALLCSAVLGRHGLESRMMTHMFVQIPMLVASGMLLALRRGRPATEKRATSMALAAFVFATGAMTTWMIPRALDAAVENSVIDALKGATLVFTGFIGVRAWAQASAIIRTFAVGNSAWMMAVAGMLFLDAPARLCASYAQGEQHQAGLALISLAVGAVVLAFRAAVSTMAQAPRVAANLRAHET